MAPLGRKRAIELVRAGKLPISFGSPHPIMAIVEQESRFRIRALVIDPDEAKVAQAEGLARGMWMPEQHYALGRPTGRIFVEAATRAELVEAMETMEWPAVW